ncbi:MAG: hypothetical protein IH831_06380, partial [Planctomycetes bacterium]|nr:hypothetical protein [Planctomycetota bacterium]
KSMWENDSKGTWKLLDWIGNHIDDSGVEKVRLPKLEESHFIGTENGNTSRDFNKNDDEQPIFL